MEVRPPHGGGIRDPFAWREALSPAVSARNSYAGSRAGGSGASTPRSATPPLSPPCGNSARSSHSNSGLSARSGGGGSARGARGGYPAYPQHDPPSARSTNSFYATPDPSARSSAFTSVYDASSAACASARSFATSELALGGSPELASGRRRPAAPAAPAPAPAPGGAAPADEASLDPRAVLSAARHGRHKEVEVSLQGGFDPTYTDTFGNTLFHVACQNGNKRIAKLAIKYGGDMDAQNGKGNTGLHFLFAYGYPDVAEYFIEKGASEEILNELGKGPREGIR